MSTVEVDTTFDAEAAAVAAETITVTMAGVECKMVPDPPVGAMIVFTRRMASKNVQDQLGGILELCDKWVDPDCIADLYDAVGSLGAKDVEGFMQTDMAAMIQAVSARPTLVQSS